MIYDQRDNSFVQDCGEVVTGYPSKESCIQKAASVGSLPYHYEESGFCCDVSENPFINCRPH